MRRIGLAIAVSASSLLLGSSSLIAQELNEVCPDSPDMTGALWGLVSDTDAEMGLPGASVVATWEKDGESGKAEGQTGLDGGYTLCYVPLGVEVAVQAVFANLGGEVVTANLAEDITRVDLAFSLTGASSGGGAGDDRMWACFGADDNQINLQNSRIIRCDSGWGRAIDRCPKTAEHGQVQATISGGGVSADEAERADQLARSPEFREALEKVVADGRRLGANALINWRQNRNSLTAEAVTIEVDPSTCS